MSDVDVDIVTVGGQVSNKQIEDEAETLDYARWVAYQARMVRVCDVDVDILTVDVLNEVRIVCFVDGASQRMTVKCRQTGRKARQWDRDAR